MKYTLTIVEDGCWNCGKLVKLPFLDNTIGPKHFNDELVKTVIEHGAIIKNSFSRIRQESYNASVCPSCNVMFGEYYLVNYWYSPIIKTIEVDSDLINTTEDGQLLF